MLKADKSYVDNQDAIKVSKTGDETINGVKTFQSSPIVPTPTNGNDAVNKTYADTNCSVTIDNKIKIPINGFDWGQKGILMKRAFVSWDDADFSDGTQDTSTIAEQTNIEKV